MQKDLEITTGSVKSRQRALRLIRHVAIGIAELKTPTNDEIIALCTEHTTLNCMFFVFFKLYLRYVPWRLSPTTLAHIRWSQMGS